MGDDSWFNQGVQYTQRNEGFRSAPYKDSRGISTVGYGFNLQAHPEIPRQMNEAQANQYFLPLYRKAVGTARSFAGKQWNTLTPSQQMVLADMAYNMDDRLYGFKNMRQSIFQGDTAGAAREMQNSAWFKQVKDRGPRNVALWSKP